MDYWIGIFICGLRFHTDVAGRGCPFGDDREPSQAARNPFGYLFNSRSAKARRNKFDVNLTGLAGGFSCLDGVLQLGDSVFAGDRIARLENALAEAFPGKSGPLIVRRYDVYLNQEAESRALGWAAASASVGLYGGHGIPDVRATQLWRAPKCGRDRMQSGWFDPSELTNNFPPITVEIEANVFGQDYSINAATSSEMHIPYLGVGASPAFNAMLQSTMDKGNTRLIKAIQANAPTTAN